MSGPTFPAPAPSFGGIAATISLTFDGGAAGDDRSAPARAGLDPLGGAVGSDQGEVLEGARRDEEPRDAVGAERSPTRELGRAVLGRPAAVVEKLVRQQLFRPRTLRGARP